MSVQIDEIPEKEEAKPAMRWRRLLTVTVTLAFLGMVLICSWPTHRRVWSLEVDLSDSLREKVSEDILRVMSAISKNNADGDCASTQHTLVESYDKLSNLLELLGNQHTVPTVGSEDKSGTKAKVGQESSPHPRDYQQMKNFSEVSELHTLLTVVFNFVHYDSDDLKHITTILRTVNHDYPLVKIVVAIPPGLSMEHKDYTDTTIFVWEKSEEETDLWNKLIAEVQTKFVYIGRNVIHFTEYDKLERLVEESYNINAYAVASSFRTLYDAKWSSGCEQSMLRNYTLTFTSGYDVSMRECLVCHHVQGPFATRTEHLAQNPLEASMTDTSGFAVWFLKIKRSGKTVVSCPDSMAFVSDQSQQPTRKEDWTDLAHFFQVEQLYPNSDQLIEFDCAEAGTGCPGWLTYGMSLSSCCMKELADGVKLVMRKCKEEGMLCELDSGTLLGAVKFNGILPWELDADITLHPNNYTAFADKLKPYFTKLGYRWRSERGRSRENDSHNLYSKNWKFHIKSAQRKMGPELWLERNIEPTVVYLDGAYVRSPASPGLQARHECGQELYKHVQQPEHVDKAVEFTGCSEPEHHACLDQYIPDGNIRFRNPVP